MRVFTERPKRSAPDIDGITSEYNKMFSALGIGDDGSVSKSEFQRILRDAGIWRDDPRVRTMYEHLDTIQSDKIDFFKFKELVQNNSSLIRNVIQKRLVIPDFPTFSDELSEIFEEGRTNQMGKVANYIPQLGRVNPEHYALGITTISGQRFSIGDSQIPFCLQSVNKPINYCLALEENGGDKIRKHVGREPSGLGFNELSLNDNGLPHNPMINAGAIICCSLIQPQKSLADRFEYVLQAWSRLSGGARINFNNPVYLSERETADRNFALGYLMRENKAFPENTDLVQTLEFYFQCCSIEIDIEGLSVVAASLANGGVCPTTGEKVFEPSTVQNCLSLMASCGMYDYSGEFAFSVGLPSKSGVSGAIFVVVPNVMGIAIWSPRLDSHSNSVRGIQFFDKLVKNYNFHVYESILVGTSRKKDPRLKKDAARIEGVVQLCWAASQGDLTQCQNLIASGVNPNWADYDGRTALHVAASEGHLNVVEFLLSKNACANLTDRWNGTALDDARRADHAAIIRLLER